MNIIDVSKLKVIVFDDADITATPTLIKTQLITPLPEACQKIFVSETKPSDINLVEMVLLTNWSNIDYFYIKSQNKFDTVEKLVKSVGESNGQMIIFFNVCSHNITVFFMFD